MQAASPRLGAAHAAILGVLARVQHECPLAATGSPQDPQSTQVSNEVIGAMVLAAIHVDIPAGRAFVARAAGLRWSNRGLTREVAEYVAHARTALSLPQPNLCADVRAWAASGFQTLPASTLSFAPRFMDVWEQIGFLPESLARYESPADRALAARAEAIEERVSALEAAEVETWGRIMRALDLWP
jgi:hypothetical protein